MMEHSVICEPVEVSPEELVRAEHIERSVDSGPVEPFHHFHDVCELIWCRKASGEMISASGVFDFQDQTMVFVPAMQSHDFRIAAGRKEWIILHIDPALVSTLINQDGHHYLEQVHCCTVSGAQAKRLDMLFEWAAELSKGGAGQRAQLTSIVKTILLEMGKASPLKPTRKTDVSTKLERLRPALNLVARNTSGTIGLEDAASACHLSPAYFSRRFKSVFGVNFSEYVRLFRLRLAARRLIEGAERVADIAFGLGFATPAHFTAVFQKRYGMTPRAFRQAARGQAQTPE